MLGCTDRPHSNQLGASPVALTMAVVRRSRETWADETWDVVCLQDRCGAEVGVPLASFGHRQHAEAFLDDLLTAAPRPASGCADRGRDVS